MMGLSAPGQAPQNDRRETPVVFIDSSAVVTLVDADDASHAAALEAYRGLVSEGYRFFTTDHVISEAYELLSAGIGSELARRWLREQRLAVYYVDERDLNAARERVLAKPADAALSLTDALSIVVMERLGVNDAFALDPSFLLELS